MSSKLHGLVWECDIQPISRKAVLARLADFSSDTGYSWPSVETIRRQVGAKSKNTATSAIKALAAEGWLEVIPRKVGGRDISNAYQLNVEKIEAEADEARDAVKQERKKEKSKFNPSKFDPSKFDPSKFAPSDSDPSKFEDSKKDDLGGQNLGGEGSTIDPDPSLEPTTDPSDKKTSCPVAAQPDETDPAKFVLNHFNQVTGSAYGRGGRTKTTLGFIRGRLAEDYSADDLVLVIDYLNAKWADDPKMSDYLRPSTLFGPDNCVEYFDKAKKWHRSGRPSCVNGRWQTNSPGGINRQTFQDVDYSLPENSGFRS